MVWVGDRWLRAEAGPALWARLRSVTPAHMAFIYFPLSSAWAVRRRISRGKDAALNLRSMPGVGPLSDSGTNGQGLLKGALLDGSPRCSASRFGVRSDWAKRSISPARMKWISRSGGTMTNFVAHEGSLSRLVGSALGFIRRAGLIYWQAKQWRRKYPRCWSGRCEPSARCAEACRRWGCTGTQVQSPRRGAACQ
jgi:hypothetical protein